LNQNRKRCHEDISPTIKIATTNVQAIDIKNKKLKKLFKKEKSPPIYSELIHPVQCLNEYHRDIFFTFENETSENNKIKYKCNVDINKNQVCLKFSGEGLSKKDSKKNCCLKALICMYGDTYKPPEHIITSIDCESLVNKNTVNILNEQESLNKRIQKLCNKNTIQFKSPAQFLNELSKNISDTGECVGENGKIPGKKFTFQYKNVRDDYDSTYGIVYGFGNFYIFYVCL